MAILRTILVFTLLAALLLCISWQEGRVRYEARRLREFEAVLENRVAEVRMLQAQVARLESPQRILLIVGMLDMALRPPGPVPASLQRQVASAHGLGIDMPGEVRDNGEMDTGR